MLTAASFNFFLSLILSVGIGLLLGSERSYSGRAAGMRTYALVCLTACILCAASIHPDVLKYGGMPGIDPTRTVQGIMTGIGFLGAGLIAREGFSIKGLTSAASIWAAAGIGVLCGLHLFTEALVSSFFAFFVLVIMRKAETMMPHKVYADLTLNFPAASSITKSDIEAWCARFGFDVINSSYGQKDSDFKMQVTLVGNESASMESLSYLLRSKTEITFFDLVPRHE